MMSIKTNKGLSRHRRTSILIRDNYTCQKCKLEDKTGKRLEIHHIKPIAFGGADEEKNFITLCWVCHKYAPNKKKEFEEYMESECNGELTILVKIIKDLRDRGVIERFIREDKEKMVYF